MVTFMLCIFCHNRKQQNKESHLNNSKYWKGDLEEYTYYSRLWMIFKFVINFLFPVHFKPRTLHS